MRSCCEASNRKSPDLGDKDRLPWPQAHPLLLTLDLSMPSPPDPLCLGHILPYGFILKRSHGPPSTFDSSAFLFALAASWSLDRVAFSKTRSKYLIQHDPLGIKNKSNRSSQLN